MKLLIIIPATLLIVIGGVDCFITPPSSPILRSQTSHTHTVIYLSDVPKDEVEEKVEEEEQWIQNNRRMNPRNWRDDWMPDPPEDKLTLAGDIASLFLYAFMDHFLNDVYLASVWASSISAADAAKTLDPSGMEIVVSSTPVWLDPTALGPHVSDQVLFWDLQAKVMPHFSPILASTGMASVTLASCWILAGVFHKAFHFQNTLDCSTHRAVAITGRTWLSSSILMILLATASQHAFGAVDANDMSTSVLMMQGRTLTPVEEWFSVLPRTDAEYIFNSLGVLLTWRFLISFLLGGWSKK